MAGTRSSVSITYTQKLKVREHSELISAQYLVRCLEPYNVCHYSPEYIQCFLWIQIPNTIYNKNPMDATLSSLSVFYYLHNSKMATQKK